jgi:hypothetical protein
VLNRVGPGSETDIDSTHLPSRARQQVTDRIDQQTDVALPSRVHLRQEELE